MLLLKQTLLEENVSQKYHCAVKTVFSPGGIEPQPWDSVLRCRTTEPQKLYGERDPLRSSYMTHLLHAARISDVDGVMFF